MVYFFILLELLYLNTCKSCMQNIQMYKCTCMLLNMHTSILYRCACIKTLYSYMQICRRNSDYVTYICTCTCMYTMFSNFVNLQIGSHQSFHESSVMSDIHVDMNRKFRNLICQKNVKNSETKNFGVEPFEMYMQQVP